MSPVRWGLAGLPLLLLASAGSAATEPGASTGTAGLPSARLLTTPAPGVAALRSLGDRLPLAAARNGLTEAALRQVLATDRTAWLDPTGKLYFVEAAPRAAATDQQGATGAAAGEAPPLPAGDTFRLHSKPGSNRVIHLDFDGHTVSGTYWNTLAGRDPIVAPAYDLDGDPATFSDAERTAIQRTWQRVASDYAGFDVDVTTQEPPATDIALSGPDDQRYGTRALFTAPVPGVCDGCGGVATVQVFNTSDHDYYQPAWIFRKATHGPGKAEADAAAHEVGHQLGLLHDGRTAPQEEYYYGHGSGPTGWAPIMGVGYERELTQWSKGEYPAANNAQDDLALIARNGTPTRPDDRPVSFDGSNFAAVAALAGRVTDGSFVVAQPGIVERSGDQDHFRFDTAGGAVRFTLAPPALYGPDGNLEAELSIVDAGNNVVAVADDPAARDATVTASLAAGTYVLRVRPVGDADPAPGYGNYGSLGPYQLGGSFIPGGVAAPVLRGDLNCENRVQLQWTQPPGVQGFELHRLSSSGATVAVTTLPPDRLYSEETLPPPPPRSKPPISTRFQVKACRAGSCDAASNVVGPYTVSSPYRSPSPNQTPCTN